MTLADAVAKSTTIVLICRIEVIYMCVKPCLLQDGIVSKLIQLGSSRAKAEGTQLVVCAEAPAKGFLVKLDYQGTRHCDVVLRKYAPADSGFDVSRLSGMIWRP
jgi:hypothetical protein